MSALFAWGFVSVLAAQPAIKVLRFEKNNGIIDHGAEDGLRAGDVFEVNRYDGDFVYWVGRVEVVAVRPQFATVKLLTAADNYMVQKGDVLELRKRELDPMLDKLRQSSLPQERRESAARLPATSERTEVSPLANPVAPRHAAWQFGITGGPLYPMGSSSQSMALRANIQIYSAANRVIGNVDLAHAYGRSMSFEAFFALPLTGRLGLELEYAYVPLNLRADTEAALLAFGLKGTAWLARVGASLQWRRGRHWQLGVGAGLHLPQVKVEGGRQSIVIADRQWGGTLGVAHLLPLGATTCLRTTLSYQVFLDDGPAIHTLALRTGPCFAIGN